jgi:hypothetical protein
MTELVFISLFNFGGIELAKNHIESLKRNNIKNYIAYVTDDESYEELLKLNYQVTKYKSNNDLVDNKKHNFATPEFNNLSYIRYNIINSILKEGKAVWYLDIDTVVLYDLNLFYNSLNKNFDMSFQNDINMLCTGCMLVMPNIKTIDLTNFMYLNKNNHNNDQVYINNIVRNNQIFNINVFNENMFPNGLLYFSEPKSEKHFREAQESFYLSKQPVYFVHANYMIGISTKIDALKSKNLWFI